MCRVCACVRVFCLRCNRGLQTSVSVHHIVGLQMFTDLVSGPSAGHAVINSKWCRLICKRTGWRTVYSCIQFDEIMQTVWGFGVFGSDTCSICHSKEDFCIFVVRSTPCRRHYVGQCHRGYRIECLLWFRRLLHYTRTPNDKVLRVAVSPPNR